MGIGDAGSERRGGRCGVQTATAAALLLEVREADEHPSGAAADGLGHGRGRGVQGCACRVEALVGGSE
jgi:hypothetical protein